VFVNRFHGRVSTPVRYADNVGKAKRNHIHGHPPQSRSLAGSSRNLTGDKRIGFVLSHSRNVNDPPVRVSQFFLAPMVAVRENRNHITGRVDCRSNGIDSNLDEQFHGSPLRPGKMVEIADVVALGPAQVLVR
jgi:hypothetical protein